MHWIRAGVFETNSSSSHSMKLNSEDIIQSPFPAETLRKGEIEVTIGEFGWEWARYYRPENKLSYLLTQMTSGETVLPEGMSAQERARQLREEYTDFDRACSIVEEFTGCRITVPHGSGYVDHDSRGVGMELFHRSDEDIRQFLFSDQCYFETGNDNSSAQRHIRTDKGTYELYYKELSRRPESDTEHMKFTINSISGSPDALSTADRRATIDSETPLFKAISNEGVVTSFVAHFVKGSIDAEYANEGEVLNFLARYFAKQGIAFTPDVHVEFDFTKKPEPDEDVRCARGSGTLVIALPPHLAEEVRLAGAPKPKLK